MKVFMRRRSDTRAAYAQAARLKRQLAIQLHDHSLNAIVMRPSRLDMVSILSMQDGRFDIWP